ncbi:MAG: NAD(P)H-hydrate dehydratase [Nitrospiraceae bacterium]|nr:MAG: NAD(P)H-hydrate dehydratase [Nitrospiraceae bacterium]
MKVVTAEEMRSIDRKTIKNYGIPASTLMERAGLAVALKIRELFEKRKVIVLSGGGNNGGDGLVVARNLFNWGWNVKVLMMSKKDRLSLDCLSQYNTAQKSGVPVEFRTALTAGDIHSALIVDALFGTGINKPVAAPLSDVLTFLNGSEVKVLSVDIPSGISSDNGQIMGQAVRADYTVTFGLPKIGHLLHPGAEYTGDLIVEDIGFPGALLNAEELKRETIEVNDAAMLLPERTTDSHKGDYGHVLVIAGSRGKTGAAIMTAKACLRAGAGMVTIGVPETLADIFQGRVTEEMVLPLPDTGKGMLSAHSLDTILGFVMEKIDAIGVGPGMGVSDDTGRLLSELVLRSPVPMVIDADGINSLSTAKGRGKGVKDILNGARSPVILTPHPGEMSRLLSAGKNFLQQDRMNIASLFSKETGTCLVLKGAPTVIAEPEGRVFINTTGNPGMATAGSGDVLTGIIASMLGQGLTALTASVLGVFLHGLAGDIAAEKKGMHSLIASDIMKVMPDAFFRLAKYI